MAISEIDHDTFSLLLSFSPFPPRPSRFAMKSLLPSYRTRQFLEHKVSNHNGQTPTEKASGMKLEGI